jgi:CYTH domain-containing protein
MVDQLNSREVEVKYLVRGDDWRDLAPGVLTRQGYLSSDRKDRSIRVRVQVVDGNRVGFLGVKGTSDGAARLEWEYDIPAVDAEMMLEEVALKPLIEKTRRSFTTGDVEWDIDEFHGDNAGLVVAEAVYIGKDDLPDPQTWEPPVRPAWVGQNVTGVVRYFNNRLAEKPYSKWPEEHRTRPDGSVAEAT